MSFARIEELARRRGHPRLGGLVDRVANQPAQYRQAGLHVLHFVEQHLRMKHVKVDIIRHYRRDSLFPEGAVVQSSAFIPGRNLARIGLVTARFARYLARRVFAFGDPLRITGYRNATVAGCMVYPVFMQLRASWR
ncbi:hypothetical protein [Bradyrhizobium sp. USDA 10063]